MNLIGRCPPSSDMMNWWSVFERQDYKPVSDLFHDKSAELNIIDLGAYVCECCMGWHVTSMTEVAYAGNNH